MNPQHLQGHNFEVHQCVAMNLFRISWQSFAWKLLEIENNIDYCDIDDFHWWCPLMIQCCMKLHWWCWHVTPTQLTIILTDVVSHEITRRKGTNQDLVLQCYSQRSPYSFTMFHLCPVILSQYIPESCFVREKSVLCAAALQSIGGLVYECSQYAPGISIWFL